MPQKHGAILARPAAFDPLPPAQISLLRRDQRTGSSLHPADRPRRVHSRWPVGAVGGARSGPIGGFLREVRGRNGCGDGSPDVLASREADRRQRSGRLSAGSLVYAGGARGACAGRVPFAALRPIDNPRITPAEPGGGGSGGGPSGMAPRTTGTGTSGSSGGAVRRTTVPLLLAVVAVAWPFSLFWASCTSVIPLLSRRNFSHDSSSSSTFFRP